MKKFRLTAVSLISALIISLCAPLAGAQGFITVSENTTKDPKGYIIRNNRSYSPLRFIMERMGVAVYWIKENDTEKIQLVKGETLVVLILGDPDMAKYHINADSSLSDPEIVHIDDNDSSVMPIKYYGSIYIPIRAAAEAFGAEVGWQAVFPGSKDHIVTVTFDDTQDITPLADIRASGRYGVKGHLKVIDDRFIFSEDDSEEWFNVYGMTKEMLMTQMSVSDEELLWQQLQRPIYMYGSVIFKSDGSKYFDFHRGTSVLLKCTE